MSEKKINVILLLLCILPFALDKLYIGKKDAIVIWLAKFVSIICIIGVVWWIFDIVYCLLNKYKLNPIK